MGVIAAIVAGVALSLGVLLIVTALRPARAEPEPIVKMRVDVRRLGSRALAAVMVGWWFWPRPDGCCPRWCAERWAGG